MKKFLRNLFIFLVIFITLLLLGMRYIGTKNIVINSYYYKNNLPEDVKNFNILYFGDVNYSYTFLMKDLDELKNKINYLEPDIIIFGGNLLTNKLNSKEEEKLINKLKEINSKHIKYYIKGVNDIKESKDILDKAGFIELDSSKEIYTKNNNKLVISPSNDIKDESNIIVLNNLDNINKLPKKNLLVLASSTYGGLIRLPKYCLFKFNNQKKYCKRELNINSNYIINTSGLGTYKVPFRLFNHPRIEFIRLF